MLPILTFGAGPGLGLKRVYRVAVCWVGDHTSSSLESGHTLSEVEQAEAARRLCM